MIKSLLVYLNVIFLSLIGFFAGDLVSVDSQIPSSANPGEAFDLVVTIKKGSIKEFAKLQMQMPVGFTVQNIDSKGGAFSFSEQTVKVIWTSLPIEEEFQVKFKVKTFSSVNGNYNIAGKFSYVLEGAKTEAICPNKSITIGTPAAFA